MGYTAQIRIVPVIVVGAMAIGAVATILAALLPARRAARIPIAEALRHST
jgi:putative ABC transport system permease protein